eukprot:11214754-Lingulodinium_polyedra.AAC.1
MEQRRAADFAGWADRAKLYCESTSLSLPRVGQPSWPASFGNIPTLSPDDLSSVLASCALF